MLLPGHFRSHKVISSHVTASLCELQPCKKSNAPKTRVFGFLQPLPGDFRSNDVTSGSLPVTWGHVTSFFVTLLTPASNSLVGSQAHQTLKFSAIYSHFQVTSGQMTSLPVTWGHVMSFSVTWLTPPARYLLVGSQTHKKLEFSAFYSDF